MFEYQQFFAYLVFSIIIFIMVIIAFEPSSKNPLETNLFDMFGLI
jgi:hypothetical protein